MQLRAITVSQLNNYIKQVFEAEELLHGVEVVGEIDGISVRGNAVYFSLRDESAVISCVCYNKGTFNPILYAKIENGSNVKVRGTVGYWHKAGKISFTVSHVEAFGLGQLFLLFKQLQEKLAKEGLFSEGLKKAIPQNAKRIAVVTSKAGAVLHDIVKVAHRRNPAVDIVVYPVQVQGYGAESQVVDGIEFFNSLGDGFIGGVDVIIVARGGGSKDDLAVFNSERIARAVFASNIPVVSAVGHETDWTLIDFVADLRAATPSVAAEFVVAEVIGLREKVMQSWRHISYMVKQGVDQMSQSIDKLWYVTHITTMSCINSVESRAKELGVFVESNNPLSTLRRGYAKIFKDDEDILGVGLLKKDDIIKIRLHDGEIEAKVEEIK